MGKDKKKEKGGYNKEAGFVKGFSYGFMAKRGEYASIDAKESLKRLSETGTEWITLCLVVMQKRYNSTEIKFDFNQTPTDLEVIKIIKRAHKLGLKVCLKPMINLEDHLSNSARIPPLLSLHCFL